MLKTARTRIVTYHLDTIESSGCFYDVPGPVIFFYRPKDKKSTTLPELDGMWVEVHPKFVDTKKTVKEQGYCIGGDYGIMRMPRYTLTRTYPGRWDWRGAHDYLNRVATQLAGTLVRQLDRSGHLMISTGDLKLKLNKPDSALQNTIMQINVGFCFTPTPIIDSYVSQAFVWKLSEKEHLCLRQSKTSCLTR